MFAVSSILWKCYRLAWCITVCCYGINRAEVYAGNGRRAEAVSRLPPGSLDIPIRVGDHMLLICMSQPALSWAVGTRRLSGAPSEWARRESTGDESLSNHRFTERSTSFALCIERRSMLNGSPRGEETGARAISSGIISLRENASPVHLSIHLVARLRYGLRLLP